MPAAASAPETGDPVTSLDERRAAIERSVLEMGRAPLRARLESTGILDADSPVLAAIVLQAGRALPPGLSAARRAQRQARAGEAMEWLRAGLDQPASAAAIKDALARILEPAPGTLASEHPMPEVARAAMGVAAALDLLELAPRIAAFLDGGPTVSATARGALLRMTGRVIPSEQRFRDLWPALRGLEPVALGRDALLEASARADAFAVRMLEFAPGAVEGEPLAFADQDAVVRGSAAILRAVAGREIAPMDALAWLGDGLVDEARPLAFGARLSAMCDLIQGADADSEPASFVAERVQGLLARGRSLHPGLAWATLSTLPRLVLPAGPEGGDASREQLLTRGLALLERCVDEDRFRPHDPDGLQGAVAALIELASSIDDDGARAAAARPLVERLMAFVATEQPLPASVRRTAASGLRLSLRPEDAEVLLGLVESLSMPELEYELLGALRAAIAVLPPGGEEAEAVLARLFEISSAPDFDRKMRALAVLASEDAAAALAAKPRDFRARWLLLRLDNEVEPEVVRAFLGILARVGDGNALEQLTENAERLRRIAAEAGAEDTMGALEDAVRTLAAGDGGRLRRAATGTLGAGFMGPSARRPGELALLRSGLRLALEADALGTEDATVADHALIVRAALELLRLEPVAGVAAFDVGTLLQIRARHVEPLSTVSSDLYVLESTVAEALIAARLALKEPIVELTPGQVIAAYGEALRVLGADAEANASPRFGWTSTTLEIDAIGYLRAAGTGEEALARLEAWIAGRAETLGPLPVSARRAFCDLALDVAAARPEALTLPRATRVLDDLDAIAADVETDAEGASEQRATLIPWLASTVAAERPGLEVLARVASSADSERYRAVMERVASVVGEPGGGDSEGGG